MEVNEQGRSARKRQAIMEAATEAFMAKGYSGTSMDDIAKMAAVSKQTVYRLVHSGHLPAVRTASGKSFRIPEAAVHDYVRESFKEAPVDPR